MLRFCEKECINADKLDIKIIPAQVVIGDAIWKESRSVYREHFSLEPSEVQLLPICLPVDHVNEVFYGYQDMEANRELRMIEELDKAEGVYQFRDLYPFIKKVLIWGCNELAYYFAHYLENQEINVVLIGEEWNYFGYQCNEVPKVDEHTMIIYAEGIYPNKNNLASNIANSASSQFECINKIYEKNVLEGKIQNRDKNMDELIDYLSEKKVWIMGTGIIQQDAYDLLYSKGIDIQGFADDKNTSEKILGKYIYCYQKIINNSKDNDTVLIDCVGKNNALGGKSIELMHYVGLERNKGIIWLADYADIKRSNLVHVLHNKSVVLAGDKRLCDILANYLECVEQGDISVRYTDLSNEANISENTITCLCQLHYGWESDVYKVGKAIFKEKIEHNKFTNYTDYFSNDFSFCLIEEYFSKNKLLYQDNRLKPRGFVLVKIPGFSGNNFMNGIIDGHPQILRLPLGNLCDNLLKYCVCLAREKASNIIEVFWKIYREENSESSIHNLFFNIELFENSLRKRLVGKKYLTSQEIFVLIHVAFAEMYNGGNEIDVSDKLIWWEHHNIGRYEVPFLMKWLESSLTKNYMFTMVRDFSVRFGSVCKRYVKEISDQETAISLYQSMFFDDKQLDTECIFDNLDSIVVRFEDVKLHPKEILNDVCERLDIKWSDSLLTTTEMGKLFMSEGSIGFDLRPVFNRYEAYLSEIDRIRVYIASSIPLRTYGYPSSSILEFSRRELQELFSKKFRFEEYFTFETTKLKNRNNIEKNDMIQWKLWDVRKRELLEHEKKIFEVIDAGLCEIHENYNKKVDEGRRRILNFINEHDKIVIYGTGKDCKGIVDRLDLEVRHRLMFFDKKAESKEYVFDGKKVNKPEKLRTEFADYYVVVSSSEFRKEIERDLQVLGVKPDRIICNTVQFWDCENVIGI